jgi:hypothetical protein
MAAAWFSTFLLKTSPPGRKTRRAGDGLCSSVRQPLLSSGHGQPSVMRGRPLPSAVHRIGPHAQSILHLFKLICPSNVPSPDALPVAKSQGARATICRAFGRAGVGTRDRHCVVSRRHGAAMGGLTGKSCTSSSADWHRHGVRCERWRQNFGRRCRSLSFRFPDQMVTGRFVTDGSRFLIAMPAGPDTSAPFTILWNRLAGLR